MDVAIYKFPLLQDLPKGLDINMFLWESPVRTPGCHFRARDTGDYYELTFLPRDFEGGLLNIDDVIIVKCPKVRNI